MKLVKAARNFWLEIFDKTMPVPGEETRKISKKYLKQTGLSTYVAFEVKATLNFFLFDGFCGVEIGKSHVS